METFIKTIIYIHAFFGGIGLISGILSMMSIKGSPLHKKSGKAFSYGILISSIISLFVCCFPGHYNIFLFLIGLFTIYLVVSGNRMLNYKKEVNTKTIRLDKLMSISMLIISTLMTILGILLMIQKTNNAILLIFFGGLGLWMSFKDLQFYKNINNQSKLWLIKHIGKMIGALIASITAFIVAGMRIGNIYSWILPSVIGTVVIVYWIRKVKNQQKRMINL